MGARYICPAQIRKNTHPFLMCELAKKEGVDYNPRENAYTIVCACQHYCPHTKRVENTDAFKACYAAKMAAKETPVEKAAETEVIAEAAAETEELAKIEETEQPKEEKTTSRRKAKD